MTIVEVRIAPDSKSATIDEDFVIQRSGRKTINESAMEECAARAAGLGRPLDVHAVAADGREFWVQVTPTGNVSPINPPTPTLPGPDDEAIAARPVVDVAGQIDSVNVPGTLVGQVERTDNVRPATAGPSSSQAQPTLPRLGTRQATQEDTADLNGPPSPRAAAMTDLTVDSAASPEQGADLDSDVDHATRSTANLPVIRQHNRGPAIHKPRPAAPKIGFQGLIYRLTRVNVGLSKRESRHNRLVARIRTPLNELHRCAFISLKGGIGKTTSAAGFGHTFAHYRADPVFVIDANPDAGTLAKRTIGEPLPGVKPLLAAIKNNEIHSLTDLSRYTRTAGRLTVLPGDPDPQAGQAMNDEDFRIVMEVIERYYSLILIDTGDGVTRPITPGILDAADSVVVAATHSKDGAEAAIETLDWLATHGYERLAKPAVVTLSAKDRVSREIDKAAVAKLLRDRAAALITIPPDSHLADAGAIDRDRLAPATRRVLMEGAAAVAGHWADINPDR